MTYHPPLSFRIHAHVTCSTVSDAEHVTGSLGSCGVAGALRTAVPCCDSFMSISWEKHTLQCVMYVHRCTVEVWQKNLWMKKDMISRIIFACKIHRSKKNFQDISYLGAERNELLGVGRRALRMPGGRCRVDTRERHCQRMLSASTRDRLRHSRSAGDQ